MSSHCGVFFSGQRCPPPRKKNPRNRKNIYNAKPGQRRTSMGVREDLSLARRQGTGYGEVEGPSRGFPSFSHFRIPLTPQYIPFSAQYSHPVTALTPPGASWGFPLTPRWQPHGCHGSSLDRWDLALDMGHPHGVGASQGFNRVSNVAPMRILRIAHGRLNPRSGARVVRRPSLPTALLAPPPL